jgi:glycosyltransferase involved in cell wall biosynthesis
MLVWSYWPLPTGGAEAQCRKLAAELKGLNVSCCVLTARQRPGDPARELEQGLAIRRLFVPQWLVAWLTAQNKPYAPKTPSDPARVPAPSGSRLVFTFLPWLLRFANCLFFMAGAGLHMLWNRNNYDVLHVPNADWIAGFAGVLGAVFRKPVLCKAANMPPLKPLASWVPFRRILEEKRRKIFFVALHEPMRDALITGGVSAESISLIPNGVVPPEEKADPGRMGHVLCAANFTQGAGHKGFDWLLQSWARVVESCPEARLCLAGDGDSSEWRAMAEDLGIESSVTFPGYIANHRDLYASATLLVVPSRHEGVPNVLLEAQAWGQLKTH